MKYFTIIENNIPVEFFQQEKDRDLVFDEFFIKDKKRFGIKGERNA